MQKDFQEAFFDKKEYGEEKKCKATFILIHEKEENSFT